MSELEPLAVHEAGHAVAVVLLGFTLRAVRVKALNPTIFPPPPPRPDEWWGETESDASDAEIWHSDETKRRSAAIVAMAGREARRLCCPWSDGGDIDCAEYPDHRAASCLVGVEPGTDEAEAKLAPIVEEARQLVCQHRREVEAVAQLLQERGFPCHLTATQVKKAMRNVGQSRAG